MSSSALLRPGSALGQYPQREDIRDSWLERMSANLVGLLRQRVSSRGRGRADFIAQVNAHTADLGALTPAALRERSDALRRELYSRGFLDPLVTMAFAIVRELAGRRLGMRHHDVQLYGGYIMLKGMIAEMDTGEGKTLTATLPAATAALAGVPVHIVTVNDFLVERDAAWMRPVYEALGLSVGTITEGLTPEQRRRAYGCDITYCTNKQLVFDYLKDRLLLGQESRRLHLQLEDLYAERPRTSRLMMRGLCYAIVDEADSVLIDEARTPLIISRKNDTAQEEIVYRRAIKIAKTLSTPRDFTIQARDRRIELTDFGRAQTDYQSRGLGGVWASPKRRDELMSLALCALHLYLPDKHYLVQDDKVQIIDEYTGRVMPDRSWERGLHQMIETKEGCVLSGRQETLARISYQRFFRRYLKLAGMTGTARETAAELWAVYRLNVVTIPPNRPKQLQALRDEVYLTNDEKWQRIVAIIRARHAEGRPVLIGTRSVYASEHLSNLLTAAGLEHQVLNARHDQEEAQIIAQAGYGGRITVATNMAGRGTDIRLAPGVAEAGGLHVLATERHEARRIDRQLFGRAGRQGDPGSCQAIVSLEDELVKDYFGHTPRRLLGPWLTPTHALPSWVGTPLLRRAQSAAQRHHHRIRRDLLKLDDNLEDMLSFSGRAE